MNQETCEKAGIAYADGVARFVGHAELYEKYLKTFPQDPNYAAMEEALRCGDGEAAFHAAHTLKGVSGNLSLNDLYLTLLPLVEALRGQADLPKAISLLPPVQEAYRRASACISSQI